MILAVVGTYSGIEANAAGLRVLMETLRAAKSVVDENPEGATPFKMIVKLLASFKS